MNDNIFIPWHSLPFRVRVFGFQAEAAIKDQNKKEEKVIAFEQIISYKKLSVAEILIGILLFIPLILISLVIIVFDLLKAILLLIPNFIMRIYSNIKTLFTLKFGEIVQAIKDFNKLIFKNLTARFVLFFTNWQKHKRYGGGFGARLIIASILFPFIFIPLRFINKKMRVVARTNEAYYLLVVEDFLIIPVLKVDFSLPVTAVSIKIQGKKIFIDLDNVEVNATKNYRVLRNKWIEKKNQLTYNENIKRLMEQAALPAKNAKLKELSHDNSKISELPQLVAGLKKIYSLHEKLEKEKASAEEKRGSKGCAFALIVLIGIPSLIAGIYAILGKNYEDVSYNIGVWSASVFLSIIVFTLLWLKGGKEIKAAEQGLKKEAETFFNDQKANLMPFCSNSDLLLDKDSVKIMLYDVGAKIT